MRHVAIFPLVVLCFAWPILAQPSCDGGSLACGNTIHGVMTEGDCPTGCMEFSRVHAFNVFSNTTLVTFTAVAETFVPALEIETADGTLVARRDGRSGEATRLAVVLQPGVHTIRVIGLPAGSSGTYTLRLTCLLADSEVFCTPDATTLCLNARFSIRAAIRSGDSPAVSGAATRAGDLFGYFTAPSLTHDDSNPEVFVKVLDGRAINGNWWVFVGGLTGFDYEVTVRDTFMKREKTWTRADVEAGNGIDLVTFRDR